MCQQGRGVGWIFNSISAMAYIRPPEIHKSYRRMKGMNKNTRSMISTPSILIMLLLLASMMFLMVYNMKSLEGVSASSVPPKLPHILNGASKLEKACDKTRMLLSDAHGFIASGPEYSNYTQNSHCQWLIRPIPTHPMKRSKALKNDEILSDSSTNNHTGSYLLAPIIRCWFIILL